MARMNAGKPVLIVDDEPDLCWALEHVLNQMGFYTIIARNGREALSLAEHTLFRTAFVDIKLPDVDGIELAMQIRGLRPDLPIVLVSGYYYEDDQALQQRMKETSISGFIGKPFLLEEVRKAAQSVNCTAET